MILDRQRCPVTEARTRAAQQRAGRRILAGCLLMAVAAFPSARADENPFGLPAPLDPSRVGSVMLHGGGDGVDDQIRQEFVRLAGGRDARVVLIPSDMCQRGKDFDGNPVPGGETIEDYKVRIAIASHYGGWAEFGTRGQVADFHFLFHDPDDDPRDEKFYDLLENATGVWLPAYDQAWLPSRYAAKYPGQTSRFQLALRNLVARGGVVGGNGGGMASLPETMIAGDNARRRRLGPGEALLRAGTVQRRGRRSELRSPRRPAGAA